MKIFFCGINTTEQNFLKSSWQVLRKPYILFLQNGGKIPQKIPDSWRKYGIAAETL